MELSLISCNIRFDNPADGPNAWQFRREFLAQTLLRHNPGLIATQEGRFHQLSDLKSLLTGYEMLEHHRSWIGERMYPTLYMRSEMFEYIASGDSWLSETPDVAGSRSFESAFPRLLTWSLVQLKNTDLKFLVVNTHLDHVKAQTRAGQVRVLAQEIKKLWDRNCPLIIMGDFNDSPESEVRKLLTDEFPSLRDAWKIFNPIEETSHHSFKGEMINGTRIDWVMVDERLQIKSCFMDKSMNAGLYPTDHFPVVCTLKL